MAKKTAAHTYIVGNWKMYKTIDEALAFIESILPVAAKTASQVMLAVPYTSIKTLADKAAGSGVMIGAQNMNDANEGAFTGEVAARMLQDAGAQFVLLGHSERRTYFHESDALINRKVKRALDCGLQPILCIGETYEEHEADRTKEVLKKQLSECLEGIDAKALSSVIIAYEPVWAIGTGLSLDAAKAGKINAEIRTLIGDSADKIPVLYGGSVNLKNAESFLSTEGVNGLLIGSASLHPETFAKIIEFSHN